MSPRVITQLPDPLLDLLYQGCPALLLTIGNDFPNTAYTWAVAANPTTIHFGADHGSLTLTNLDRERHASLQIIGPDNFIFLIKGSTSQVKPRIEAAPFKIAMLALEVVEVKDQSWPGVSVWPLVYNWSPEQRQEMLAIERAIYNEMREWNS